jgi:HD domain
MASRKAEPTDAQTRISTLSGQPGSAARAPRSATGKPSSLIRSAMKFAACCHASQRRASDQAPFIEHPVEVARLLRDAGCPDVVIAAGLLHDVLENSPTSVAELTACFGAEVANLVQAVSDDPSIPSYRQRKQQLREQVRKAGGYASLYSLPTRSPRYASCPTASPAIEHATAPPCPPTYSTSTSCGSSTTTKACACSEPALRGIRSSPVWPTSFATARPPRQPASPVGVALGLRSVARRVTITNPPATRASARRRPSAARARAVVRLRPAPAARSAGRRRGASHRAARAAHRRRCESGSSRAPRGRG